MVSKKTLRNTLQKELLEPNSLLKITLFSFLYYSLSVLLLNYKLVGITVVGNFPIIYKLNILITLITGSFSAFSITDSFLLVLTSILVSLNLVLILKTLSNLRKLKSKLTITAGGSAILGVFAAGCTSCGFSLISILGVAGAFSLIPFGGLLLHLIVLITLLLTFIYNVKTYHSEVICRVN